MDKINSYLLDEKKNEKLRMLCLDKMAKNPDVKEAFEKWIDVRDFENIGCPVIEGYDAARLSKETNLSPMGIFNYLVYLRTSPEEAL